MQANTFPYAYNQLPEIGISFSCDVPVKRRIQICDSINAAKVFRQIWDSDLLEYQEQICILYLTRYNTMLGYRFQSRGGLTASVVDIKHILGIALKANASSIIVCHNHPSSNKNPSVMDKQLTKSIGQGAKYLGISLLDHLILTKDSYYSFSDAGKLSGYIVSELGMFT